MPEKVYINGQIVSAEAARVSPLTEGFLYGAGLFETMRAYRGRYVFQLKAHLDRLFRSASVLGLDISHTASDLATALHDTLAANAITQDAYVRLTIAQDAENAPTVLIAVKSLLLYPENRYQRGITAIIADVRRNITSPLARIKSLNYLENLIVRRQARESGVDEAIFLDTDGYLAEGVASNLFWAKSDAIYTPSLDCPILPGITRSVVVELAREEGFQIETGRWEFRELLQADEAFLTNTLMEVMPLTRVAQTRIGGGQPGEVAKRLLKLYRRRVEESCD